MSVTDQQFLDHANQNNGEFTNRRIKIHGTGAPTGANIAPYKSLYVDTDNDNEYVNNGTLGTPSWVAYPDPDLSSKEDVGAAQTELRASVPTAGDTLNKLYLLIQALGSGMSIPVEFDADTATLFPTGVAGDAYVVNVAGTVDTIVLGVGDFFWTDTSTTSGVGSYADWYILPNASDLATEIVAGLVKLATQAEAEALTAQSNTVVLTVLRGWQQIVAWWNNTLTTTGKNLSENDLTDALLTKLNGIETGATADLTGAEIKTLLYALADTNNLTDVLLAKLNSLSQISEAVTRYTDTIVGHGFSVGDPIAINNTTNGYDVSDSVQPQLTHLGFVTAVNGDDVTISINGYIDITGWGLTAYTKYYLDEFSALITTDNGFPVLQTITATEAILISRGSGGGSGEAGVSTPYYVEGVFDGATNQVDLGREADDILVVSLGGDTQRRSQFTIDNTGANTVIIFEDTAADLNSLAYNIVFINNAIFGDVTINWDQINNPPIPDGNNDITYYLRPAATGNVYELAVLPAASNPTLQTVTAQGNTSTLAITVAGVSLTNYSTRALLYVDTDSAVKQASLATGLSISVGGELSGAFLPLLGGVVTGNLTVQGTDVILSGITQQLNSSYQAVHINPTDGKLSYRGVSLDYVLSIGNLSTSSINVGNATLSALASAGNSLVYVSSIGKFYKLTLGTNLSLDGSTLNAAAGSGGVTISGTENYLSKFNSAGDNIVDTQLMDDGTSVAIFTAPIAGSSFRVIKSNTTNLVTFGNTATSGSVLRLELPSGGSGTQNYIVGYQGATLRFNVDISGKGFFQNLNIALGVGSTLPLQITTAGNVLAGQIDYDTQIANSPTIPAAQVNSDWNSTSGVAQILNKPTIPSITVSGDYESVYREPSGALGGSSIMRIGEYGKILMGYPTGTNVQGSSGLLFLISGTGNSYNNLITANSLYTGASINTVVNIRNSVRTNLAYDRLLLCSDSTDSVLEVWSGGKVLIKRLPTSSAGLATGQLWNDAGTVKVSS